MKVSEVAPNTRVKLHTKNGDFSCIILDSPNPEVILVKLESGYNIGIKEEDILNLEIIGNKDNSKETKSSSLNRLHARSRVGNAKLGRIALIVTGGTISSKLDKQTGAVKWLTNPQELLDLYPELKQITNISEIKVPFMKASENMGPKDWEILSEITANFLNCKSIDGVVITHGTDFLHYSASALSFALSNLNKPVVLTYSQRSSDRASSDARLNLICAARAAVSDIAEVMLVGHANLDDEYCYAIRGTKVRKMHSSRRDTFRPINSKPIAKVFPDKIEIISSYNLKDKEKRVNLISKFSDKVALIKFYPGQNPDIFDYYLLKGYKGLIIEMSGLGHVLTGESNNNWLPKLRKVINSGTIVCAVPQTIYGRLDPLVYSVGREIKKVGVIYLEDILPETAFVKLCWILGNKSLSKDKETIYSNLLRNIAGEFNYNIRNDEFLN
ncbi:MAG: Glu-tRNA(Gln) amidotransferase subunit GatD [Candidatus Pacearchaeota archaeon]